MGEKKRKRPEEAVGFWEEVLLTGMFSAGSPSHPRPGCGGTWEGQCGQDPGTGVPARSRPASRQKQHPAEWAPRRSGFSLPKEVPTGRLDHRG